MSYNIKLSDYSLLPKRAIPLDARSHFESFAGAYNAITADVVTTVEASNNIDNDYKKFYAGQIITTTSSGTWQVVLKSTIDIYLKYDSSNRYKVRWNGSSITDERKDLYALKISDTQLDLYDSTNALILSVSKWNYWSTTDIFLKIDSCLVPFSGGSGSGGTLKLSSIAPINVDNSNKISLSLDTNSALTVNKDNQLTLSVGAGIKTVNNQITLSINENSNLSIIDNKLSVSGTHFYKTKSDDDTNVPKNNYIYQEI